MNEPQVKPAATAAQLPAASELPAATEVVEGAAAEEAGVAAEVLAMQASVAALQQEVAELKAELKAQLEAAKQRDSLPALVGNPAPTAAARPLTGLALIRAAIAGE